MIAVTWSIRLNMWLERTWRFDGCFLKGTGSFAPILDSAPIFLVATRSNFTPDSSGPARSSCMYLEPLFIIPLNATARVRHIFGSMLGRTAATKHVFQVILLTLFAISEFLALSSASWGKLFCVAGIVEKGPAVLPRIENDVLCRPDRGGAAQCGPPE